MWNESREMLKTQIDQMSRLGWRAVCHLTPHIRRPLLLRMADHPTHKTLVVEYGPCKMAQLPNTDSGIRSIKAHRGFRSE